MFMDTSTHVLLEQFFSVFDFWTEEFRSSRCQKSNNLSALNLHVSLFVTFVTSRLVSTLFHPQIALALLPAPQSLQAIFGLCS